MLILTDIRRDVRSYAGALRQFGNEAIDDNLLVTMVNQSVLKYSKDSPYKATAIVTKLTMPRLIDRHIFNSKQLLNWESGFSFIYKIMTQDVPPLSVNFELSDTGYIYLTSIVDSCVVEYAISHTCTATLSTIPEFHKAALVYLSLSELCDVLSLRYEHGIARPIQDVDINFDTKAAELRRLSQMYLEKYYSDLGGTKTGVTTAVHDQHKVNEYSFIRRNRRLNRPIERV